MSTGLLGIYLNDHHAGAVGGIELARRIIAAEEDGPVVDHLRRLLAEIEEDRAELLGIMKRLGVAPNPVKAAGAWAAEKIGRLKLNGRLVSRSPLSLVEELEVLQAGVDTKGAMWRALREVDPRGVNFGVDLERLIESANRQVTELERLRLEAATRAFS
jgi:hypothetical protein